MKDSLALNYACYKFLPSLQTCLLKTKVIRKRRQDLNWIQNIFEFLKDSLKIPTFLVSEKFETTNAFNKLYLKFFFSTVLITNNELLLFSNSNIPGYLFSTSDGHWAGHQE